MNLIINKETKEFHISSLEVLGENEIIIKDYTLDEFSLNNTQFLTVNKELTGVYLDTNLQADYDSKQYARDRAADYPSIADQLDTLYHGGIDAWKAEVKAVKDKYPKG